MDLFVKGKYIQSLFRDDEYRARVFPNTRSNNAIRVKALAWSEIITELKGAVPALLDI
jgi:hypothetical protein